MGNIIEEVVKDMTPRLVGEPYKRRTSGESSRLRLYALYECAYCKKEFEAQVSNIKNGGTQSCGCQKNKQKITHGRSNSRFYKTWKHMVGRCSNPNNKDYKDYGARGIIVCDEWLDIRNFTEWCNSTYPKLEDYTLDRIDNDKGYSPENCTWSDKTTQAINQRIMKNNKSGYVGVRYHSRDGVWTAYISVNNTRKYIGSFPTIEEAVLTRDNYIIENSLPHKLSTEYKKEK